MPPGRDFGTNADLSKPSRSPTSGRTSPAVDGKDQPDNRIQQRKRARKDQDEGQRKRKAHFRTSPLSDREQEECCHTDPAIHRQNEDRMNGVDSDISPLNLEFSQLLVQSAESLKEKNQPMQHNVKSFKYCKSQDKDYTSLVKAYREEAEKHCNVSIKCDKLRKALESMDRIFINPRRKIRNLRAGKKRLVRRNKYLVRENGQLVQKNDQLVQKHDHLVQKHDQLVQKNKDMVRENDELVQEKKHLIKENNRQKRVHDLLYGKFLARDWCVKNSQRTAKLMEEQIEQFERSAREKDEEIRQHERRVEELTKTIQEMNTIARQQLKLNKQQQETNASLKELLRGTLELNKNQQKTEAALTEVLLGMHASSQEQATIRCFDEPIRTSDDCLPTMPVPCFSAPASLPDTHQQQTPMQASSSGMVNFLPFASSDPYISGPASLASSVRSQDFGGARLQVPFLQGYQDVSR